MRNIILLLIILFLVFITQIIDAYLTRLKSNLIKIKTSIILARLKKGGQNVIFALHCLVCKLLMALLLDLMDCKALIENDGGV